MSKIGPTRRQVLVGSAAAASALGWPRASVRAAPPSPESITPQLIEAARKEGAAATTMRANSAAAASTNLPARLPPGAAPPPLPALRKQHNLLPTRSRFSKVG